MRVFLLAGSLLCMLAITSYAQQDTRIYGLVNDGSGQPLASVNVSLFGIQDSSLVKVATTDKAGLFEFPGIN